MAGKLEFAEGFDENDLVLMQVDSHVLDSIEAQQSDSVCLKATGTENVVLCTATHTYAVKHADVSNAYYLVPPVEGHKADALAFPPESPRQVQANVSTYLELKHVDADVTRVYELLQQCCYSGPDEEQTRKDMPKYTLDALLEEVQASREEILRKLSAVHAFEHKGVWRVLDERYKFEVMDLLLKTAAGEDWDLHRIPFAPCVQSLADCDIPAFVIRAVLAEFAEQQDDTGETWSLKEEAVCRFRAAEFLQIGSSWDLGSFMETWEASLPEGVGAKTEYLKGLALISAPSDTEERQTIDYFPASALPVDPKRRFAALFDAKPVWSADEIEPYIRGIVSKLQTKEALLLKHARAFDGKDGTRLYNRK